LEPPLLSRSLGAISVRHPTACPNDPTTALSKPSGDAGVLEIPSLGLRAPVLNGLTDAVLNVAVGHLPTAPWPGLIGESVFEAHDVSYFAGLSGIRNGAVVDWETPCATAQFIVTGTSVRSPGEFISTPPGGFGLALITCWPTNALFWTNRRWVVTTTLVKTTLVARPLPNTNPIGPAIAVPAPASLVAQNLTLEVEASSLAAYFGAYKAIATQNRSWWSALAPGLPMPSSWPRFSSVDMTITMAGETPHTITLASSTATMQLSVSHDTLTITGLD
jgi:sortase A